MFKCFDCGHLFEHGEERKVVEPHGEEYLACPCCGGTYEETVQCNICNGHHFEGELYNGLCITCIGDRMNFENMQAYLEESNLEQAFYVEEFYESNVHYASKELIELCRSGFNQKVKIDQLYQREESQYIEQMRKFIVDDHFGLYDFAEWVNKKEGLRG